MPVYVELHYGLTPSVASHSVCTLCKTALVVIPAKAGIQMRTGYFFVFEKVACPFSGRLAPRFRGGWPE